MIYQALGFPEECAARWTHLMEADGGPDNFTVPPVETDPIGLALALKQAGHPINLLL